MSKHINMDVESCIHDLLFDNDIVVIPDFGGFITHYKPSFIDYAQNMMHPPSKSLTFNENLTINDGVLYGCLKAKYAITTEQAHALVASFVANAKSTLSKDGTLVIPEVGRLYQDHLQKLQLLPDSTNFNKDSYGLPMVDCRPLARTEEVIANEQLSTNTETLSRPTAIQRLTPYLPLFFVVGGLLLVSVFYYNNKMKAIATTEAAAAAAKAKEENNKIAEAEMHRINQSPSQGQTSDLSVTVPQVATTEHGKPETTNATETTATKANPKGDVKSCIVIIGGFADNENVGKLKRQIKKEGFGAFIDEKNGLNRVGVQFEYTTDEEKTKMLATIRGRYNPDAWILKKS